MGKTYIIKLYDKDYKVVLSHEIKNVEEISQVTDDEKIISIEFLDKYDEILNTYIIFQNQISFISIFETK